MFNLEEKIHKAKGGDIIMDKGKRRGFTYDENAMEEQRKKMHRHSSQQINVLEEYFKHCSRPSQDQRQQLSEELGLEPKQVKSWFQNKRYQIKVQKERVNKNATKAENEILHRENIELREALKNPKCAACNATDPEMQNLQLLMFENALLKKEHERLSRMLFSITLKPSHSP